MDQDANTPAAPARKRRAAPAPALTRVRVLSDCAFGLCGEVADIPAELVAAARARAQVDDNPDAVAYAEAQAAARAQSERSA